MKNVVMTIVMVAMMCGNACAEWTTSDTLLEATYQIAAGVDMMQTISFSRRPTVYERTGGSYVNSKGETVSWSKAVAHERTETNPVLGKHPSTAATVGYFVGTGIAHAAISYGLTKVPTPKFMKDYGITWSRMWQGVTIGVEVGQDVRNYEAGVRFNF